MLFENILSNRLRLNIVEYIEGRNLLDGKNIHKSSLDGLVGTLTKALMYSEAKKHYNSAGHYDGNHVLYSDITLLMRNKLSKHFTMFKLDHNGEYVGKQYPFFERANNSTYHANNAKVGSNGYSHWYVYHDVISKSLREAYRYFKLAIRVNNKFYNKADDYARKLSECYWKPDSVDLDDFLIIKKEKFEFIVDNFINGVYEGGSILINRLEFIDDKFVYVRNTINKDSRLCGNGRTYTTLSSLRSDVRKFIFEGYNEVDINSSVQTVMLNLYYNRKMSMDVIKEEFPMHYMLLTNKSAFRQKVSYLFKCSIDDAKRIITSITYSPKSRIIYKHCVRRNFNANRTKQCKKFINPFIEETLKIRKNILNDYYYKNEKLKDIIDKDIHEANENLKGKGKGKSLDDRRIYRIYEIFENIIRLAMINYTKKFNSELYQIHDCIIYKNFIDVRYLLNYILNRTGFAISAHRTIL